MSEYFCTLGLMVRVLVACWCVGVSLRAAEDVVPPIQVRERSTPWGVVVSRDRFYMKNGEEVLHGLQEAFEVDGSPLTRFRYVHGQEHGVSEIFYDGLGVKQAEWCYAQGDENGWQRTWDPLGKVLFEGFCKDGKKQNGWFETKSVSSSGLYDQSKETWTIEQWKNGKKVPDSAREVEASWSAWQPGRLPDPQKFIRWQWRSYEIKSDYPYLDHMPDYQNVPVLFDFLEKKDAQHWIVDDQLQALTRVAFSDLRGLDGEKGTTAVEQWRAWWEEVGKHRPHWQAQRGVRDAEAWKLARRGRNLPLPEVPIVIPDEYELTVNFRSGDYDGVITETLLIKRKADGAELIRRYSTSRDEVAKEERWSPFDAKEADRLVRAIGYLVDQPWLINDEAEIEKRYQAAGKKDPTSESPGAWGDEIIKGRESYGQPYYPSTSYELRDAARKLWWNADPDQWHGGNPARFHETDLPVSGIVYPFLAALYPETTRADDKGKAGWTE